MVKGYLDTVLADDEQVLYRAYVSPWSFLGDYLLALLFLAYGAWQMATVAEMKYTGAVFILLAMMIVIRAAIAVLCTELAITSKRFIAKIGFIMRDVIETPFAKIESIKITQSIFGRIFNFGALVIFGTGTEHAPIRGVHDPLEFRRQYDAITTTRVS
ncbi:MAG: PH domain-containing protein [Bdellovibrionales bacterium]